MFIEFIDINFFNNIRCIILETWLMCHVFLTRICVLNFCVQNNKHISMP